MLSGGILARAIFEMYRGDRLLGVVRCDRVQLYWIERGRAGGPILRPKRSHVCRAKRKTVPPSASYWYTSLHHKGSMVEFGAAMGALTERTDRREICGTQL
ncbi:hypothetical protein EVAR_62809_1 [Eumeta japonica]|uniref:Uncharacterized protein n=1 Tax=Eumeta variegata TaxID=151549 RepID=A0A4C1ZQU6_EUMVA|nr:hypothetical protein EVAR_62809_1 [Eumeta japonica]